MSDSDDDDQFWFSYNSNQNYFNIKYQIDLLEKRQSTKRGNIGKKNDIDHFIIYQQNSSKVMLCY